MIKVIMDVDTDIDDSVAIMMALQPEIEIVCMTTGGRNTSVRIAGVNTLDSRDRRE
jgi:inosine-uridine nucleoside N-ribohydrolase